MLPEFAGLHLSRTAKESLNEMEDLIGSVRAGTSDRVARISLRVPKSGPSLSLVPGVNRGNHTLRPSMAAVVSWRDGDGGASH